MRPLLVAAGAWPSVPPRHRAIAFVEARAVAADGAATTTRWTGGDDGSIVRWETKTGDADPGEPVVPVAFLGGHSGRVTALAVSEEDGLLLSGDDDGVVCAWDTRTNACVARREVFSEPSSCAVVSIAVVVEKKNDVGDVGDDALETRDARRVARAISESNVVRALEPRTLSFMHQTGSSDDTVVQTNDERVVRSFENADDAFAPDEPDVVVAPRTNVANACPFDPDASLAEAWRRAFAEPGLQNENENENENETFSKHAYADVRRATSCRLLRGPRGVFRALAVGLDDGDVRVERLVSPPRGGGETGETGVPYARGGKQAVENSVERGDDSDETVSRDLERSAAAIPRRFGTTTTSAVVGGLLVTGSADGSVSFWDFSLKKKEEATARHEPSLVASLAHHACGVRAVAALPMAVEDAFASDADDARGGTRGNRTGNRRLGISVDGEGVVGVFSVTYARRDARGGVAKRARCEMLLRPRIDLRLTRDDVRRRTEPVDGVDGSDSEVPSSDDETREGNGFLQKAGVDDDVRLADVRLVWDARRGVLTALRGFRAKRTRGSRSSRSVAPYAVAYDILGNTVERSLEDDAALAFFAEARRRTGAAEMRVGDARGDVGWETNADASDDASDDTSDEFFGFERERRAGSVARARVVDVVALLTRASRADEDHDDDDETRTVCSVASALHAWGRDEEADRAASDAFGVRCRSMPPFNAVLGEGNAVTVSVPVSGARHTLANDILSREWRDPRSDAERAVAVAACAARLAFVAARRFSRRDEDLKTRCSGDEGGDTKADEKADSERRTLERLHAAVARLSTSRTFTTPEHLAAFASLRHSPCVPIQDAAKALFRANVEDVEDVDTSASVVDARCDLSHQVLESARAAVAAAEASLASEADAVRHLRAGAGPEACRGASRKAKALAEEAVRLAAPVVVAAARRVYSARDAKQKKTSEKTSEKKSVSNLVRALVALLAAPHAVLVADAASLLAEGVDLNGWSNALSETELVSLQTETFALADAFGGIGGLFAHSSSRSFVASRATETIAARDATHALLATLASERPASFVAHLARRLARAPAESPAHMAAFLALASVAREKPHALERDLDAVAAVVATASSASTPALRKACRAGARALAADLAQHSGRAAYFGGKARDAERLAVVAEEGDARTRRVFSIHVYDLVVGAKVRTLREEDDEDVAAADESGAAAAAAASVMHAANELSGAFSGFSLGALASSSASEPPETKQSRNSHQTVRRSVDVIPSPDDADGNQRYAAAAAAAAMVIAAKHSSTSRRSTPRASPRASPRVSLSSMSSPRRDDREVFLGSTRTPMFALAFDDEGARLAGYRDAKRASRVRVWHVSPTSLFSRPTAFANLASLGARVSGAVAGAAGASQGGVSSAGFVAVVGCAESFLCGDTAEMAERTFQDGGTDDAQREEVRPLKKREGTAEPPRVTLEWRGGAAVVLRRGNVEAAFGVKA